MKGLTWNSVSIGWTQPGEERIREHVDYYMLTRNATGVDARYNRIQFDIGNGAYSLLKLHRNIILL